MTGGQVLWYCAAPFLNELWGPTLQNPTRWDGPTLLCSDQYINITQIRMIAIVGMCQFLEM